MRRWTVLLLAATILLTVLSGCNKKVAVEDNEQHMTEISVEVFDRGSITSSEGSMEDNRWTRWVNEQMQQYNIRVKFVPIPRKEEETMLNLLFASNEAPDICYTYKLSLVCNFAEAGGLLELDKLVKEHGPDLTEFYETRPGLLDLGKYKGKQYGLPSGSWVDGAHALAVRKDWVDALGKALPENREEYYHLLKDFKEKDPGNVGKERVIPETCAVGGTGAGYNNIAVLSSFGITNYELVNTFDGKVYPMELQPGYRDYVIFMNKLYKEGLISNEFAVDTDGKKSIEHTYGGLAGAWSGNHSWLYGSINEETRRTVPSAEWTFVNNFPDESGKIHKVIAPAVGVYNIVPKSCENPDAVMIYLNWMAKEGGKYLMNGAEGEHYTLLDGYNIPKDREYNTKTLAYAGQNMALIRPDYYDAGYYELISDDPVIGRLSKDNFLRMKDGAITPEFSILDEVLSADIKYGTTLSSLTKSGIVKAIVSDDPGREYDKFKAEYLKSGGQEKIDEMNEVYKRMSSGR
ncbi:MAG: extracellular solute-binding protein [Firmicutes bacterium]|nr:extracellular solute-binding protein [Bacillota bacterium]